MQRPVFSSAFSIDSLIGPVGPRVGPVVYNGYVLVPGGPSVTPPPAHTHCSPADRPAMGMVPAPVALTSPPLSQAHLLSALPPHTFAVHSPKGPGLHIHSGLGVGYPGVGVYPGQTQTISEPGAAHRPGSPAGTIHPGNHHSLPYPGHASPGQARQLHSPASPQHNSRHQERQSPPRSRPSPRCTTRGSPVGPDRSDARSPGDELQRHPLARGRPEGTADCELRNFEGKLRDLLI